MQNCIYYMYVNGLHVYLSKYTLRNNFTKKKMERTHIMKDFNLKRFREEYVKMTQAEFAKKIGVNQDRISRWEKNPNSISIGDLISIAKFFQISLDDLVNFELNMPKSLTVSDCWSNIASTKNEIINYLNSNHFNNTYSNEKKNELINAVKNSLRKPKIGFVGHSDVGKSTIINALLGIDKMPVAWTPTTYITVFVKHISDRPQHINSNVALFRNTEEDKLIEDWKVDSKEYFDKYFECQGDYDLLKEYGTRMGTMKSEEITSAIVYIDSDVLINCDFIDLPGYGTGDIESDDTMTSDIIEKQLDVVVYMSVINQFLQAENIEYLKNVIKQIVDVSKYDQLNNPLANVFIVGSQAHIVDSDKRDIILEKGCERFIASLSDKYWDFRKNPEIYTKDVILDRFYQYTTNEYSSSERFILDLTKLIEKMPEIILTTGITQISQWIKNYENILKNEKRKKEEFLYNRENLRIEYQQLIENEPNRKKLFESQKSIIRNSIKNYRDKDKLKISNYYDELINEGSLVDQMKVRGIRKNKEDIQAFGSYITGTLQDGFNTILTESTTGFRVDMENFFANLRINVFKNNTDININGLNRISFESLFASGLVGLGSFGALAFWASTCGNLGGYILVAKGLGVLGSLGISLGSAAGVMTAVSALGGPVVLGIGIAILAGLSFLGLRNWRKDVAKQIVSQLNSKDVKSKLLKETDKWWDDTLKAFDAGVMNIEKEWIDELEEKEKILKNFNSEAIKADIYKIEHDIISYSNVPFYNNTVQSSESA